jgi:flagellar biosynthesis protein FlhB
MATEKDSKTEKPTERKLSDAKEKGDIPRSKDLSATAALFFSILFFTFFIPFFAQTTLVFWKRFFSQAAQLTINKANLFVLGKDFFNTYIILVVPLFLLLVVLAVAMEIVQGGGLKIISENLKIKWDKVAFWTQIGKGLKKIVMSAEALFELVKSIVKVVIIFIIAYFSLRGEIPGILSLPNQPLGDILELMGKVFLKLAFNITVFLLIISIFDYMWQRHQYMKKLKMSKQDIKDEFKQAEGDPQVKGKQKKIQFQWAMRRMMAEVPQADVVITNPTHYAVAIKYEFKKMASPQLVAKGQNLVAQRIKEIAKENNVPVVENPPVARAVFAAVEIGEFIPENLFKPIAEILAYIYKLKGKRFN